MKKNPIPVKVAVILMAMSLTRRPMVVLDFKEDIEDFIFDAREIYNSMNADPLFVALAALLTTLDTDTDTLQDTHAGMHSVPPTYTKGDRDTAKETVITDLRNIKLEVQKLVNANPSNAQVIVDAAKMHLREAGAINKQDFAAKNGNVTGTAKLVAKGRPHERYANEWAYSLDGTNWIPLPATLAANTLATGLTRASIIDFRHRYILKDGPTDWLYVYDWLVN